MTPKPNTNYKAGTARWPVKVAISKRLHPAKKLRLSVARVLHVTAVTMCMKANSVVGVSNAISPTVGRN
jgi:hypothetical protein